MCASTGKFNLEKISLEQLEENEEDDSVPKLASKPAAKKPMVRRQTDSQLESKQRGGSLKKTGSNITTNGAARTPPLSKKQVGRTTSGNK